MSYGAPKASHWLQSVRWRRFVPQDMEELGAVPARLVHIVRVVRTDYYMSGDEDRILYRHTKYRAGKLVNEWEIGEL